jgi:FlaA1/EpsC-like NDP-sugar epimerase
MKMMTSFGFRDISIDATTHDSAFIVSGNKGTNIPTSSSAVDLKKLKKDAESIACYWQSVADKIGSFEKSFNSRNVAIYGAGFYGTYIFSHIKQKANVVCFVDQNCHLQGTNLLGIPILSPDNIPTNIDSLYVGLNPKYAQKIISNLDVIADKKLNTLYL